MKLPRRRCSADIPSMAMGDIAFNLLIFFVILARPQPNIPWTPARAADLERGTTGTVSVAIDKDSKLYLNGEEVGLSSLTSQIESLLGSRPVGNRDVLVKVHKDALGQRWGPVLEAIGAAGGEAFLVLEQKRGP